MRLIISTAMLTAMLRAATAFHHGGGSVASFGAVARSPSVVPKRTLRAHSTISFLRSPTSSSISSFASAPALNVRGGASSQFLSSSSTKLAMTKERPFQSWTFDKYCESMDWTSASSAELSVSSASEASLDEADLIIVGVFAPAKDEDEEEEDESEDSKEIPAIEFEGKAKELDEALGGALTELAMENSKAFQNGGEAGAVTPVTRIVSPGGSKPKRYMLMGLGTQDKDVESTTIMKAGSAVAAACHAQKKISSCNILLPSKAGSDPSTITDFATSFYSNLYADNRYRTGKKVEIMAEDLTSVNLILEADLAGDGDSAAAVQMGQNMAKGISLTKDIVNAPHNILNSMSLADTAKRIAAESSGGSITCTILGKEECEERGMGAYLGVARGSETDPQFIHLTYKPSGEIKKKVGIIGKGLLFDTGGYNIKTAMMELMKFDCGGAAAVLGAARAIGELQPEGVEAHFIVAACENMINDRAMVPSDILTASNGKTIEVLNTDAEGRLTLADALVYADKELECESIIELSTLTGACMISLGKEICGVWTDDDDLASSLSDVSKATGDKSWRMPMAKEYAKQLKSKIADISNIGDRWGGAITAALFLQEFVSKKKPFAHLDIAGPVWNDEKGATGFGAKLVTEWVRRQGQ